ncbi:sulfurtransferase TusA family protein [Paracoccus sp. R12_2]|uniref:sulfurtransferase TusA family protein n=1 Tax=unclassified Paracoccus (in: a-proteobacteria) TaxID=2688777 RepID=UPI0032AF45ED
MRGADDGRGVNPDGTIDARGLLCPLPVLRLRKALAGVAPGTRLRLIATDPMAAVDVPHFCREAGHVMIGVRDLDKGAREYTVQARSPARGAKDMCG